MCSLLVVPGTKISMSNFPLTLMAATALWLPVSSVQSRGMTVLKLWLLNAPGLVDADGDGVGGLPEPPHAVSSAHPVNVTHSAAQRMARPRIPVARGTIAGVTTRSMLAP